MRVAIVGAGRMGTAIATEAARRGHDVVATIDIADNPAGEALTQVGLAGADVVFEFTAPEAAATNLQKLATLGTRVVTGTTGWTADLPAIAETVRRHRGALLHAANFSIGMLVMRHAARTLAQQLRGRPEFDEMLHECHHRAKVDAPSGSALLLQRDLLAVDPDRTFPIGSERVGWVPGTHRVTYDAQFETLTLIHTARDRAVFAVGAVVAGEWLADRRGVFTFDDVLTQGGDR